MLKTDFVNTTDIFVSVTVFQANPGSPCVLCVRGGGVHDVYTRWLVTVNYSLYTHFKYLCLNLYVYLYLRLFLDIFISCVMYLTFHYCM